MPADRTNRSILVLTCCTLATALIVCAGPALLARRGGLPAFDAEIQLWQGATLTLHSTSANACGTASRCPHQIKIEPALSVWLIWQVRRRGNVDVFGRRLLFIPVQDDKVTR
jgi:hypothetical protein